MGNAAVGRYNVLTQEKPQKVSPVFFVSTVCGGPRGSALGLVQSDGNPCFGVRGEKQFPTERSITDFVFIYEKGFTKK